MTEIGHDAPPGRAKLRWKLLACVLAPIIALAILEAAVRIAGIRPRHPAPIHFVGVAFTHGVVWDDDLFWRVVPGTEHPKQAGEHLNSRGFRGPDFDVPKPGPIRRVLCLGDSCTFGVDVPEDATFARRLERWLDAGSPEARWEVVNAGVPGYTLWQMMRFLDLQGASISPEVVVVYAGAANEYGPTLGDSDPIVAERVLRSNEGLGRLRLVQLARSWFRKPRTFQDDEKLIRRETRSYASDGSRVDPVRVPTGDFDRLLRELDDAVRKPARLVVLVPPAPAATRREWPEGERYADILRRVSRERGIPCVDLRALFAGFDRPDRELFTDHIHPSVEGHRLIFDALAAEIARLDLVPPPPPGRGSSEPIRVQRLLEGGLTFLEGDPLVPGSPSRAAIVGGRIRTPAPCQLRLENVAVPAQASLLVDFAPGDPRPGHPQGTTLRILAGVAPESRVVMTRTFAAGHEPGRAETCRADLAAFGGRSVTLVLDVSGTAGSATWGDVRIEPYR